jgi:hypothetical protein
MVGNPKAHALDPQLYLFVNVYVYAYAHAYAYAYINHFQRELRTSLSKPTFEQALLHVQVTGKADAHKIRHINMAGHMIKNIPLELTNAPPLLTLHLGYNLLQTINPRLFAMQVRRRTVCEIEIFCFAILGLSLSLSSPPSPLPLSLRVLHSSPATPNPKP